ncbi:MAG: transposase, partial [Bryobacteraceae bacterium]
MGNDQSRIWDYTSPAWAGKFLDEWCQQTMRSRIEPMRKIARSLRQHRKLILNFPGSEADFQWS